MVFLRAKVIVIGDSCVGKSAICQVLGTVTNLNKIKENLILDYINLLLCRYWAAMAECIQKITRV